MWNRQETSRANGIAPFFARWTLFILRLGRAALEKPSWEKAFLSLLFFPINLYFQTMGSPSEDKNKNCEYVIISENMLQERRQACDHDKNSKEDHHDHAAEAMSDFFSQFRNRQRAGFTIQLIEDNASGHLCRSSDFRLSSSLSFRRTAITAGKNSRRMKSKHYNSNKSDQCHHKNMWSDQFFHGGSSRNNDERANHSSSADLCTYQISRWTSTTMLNDRRGPSSPETRCCSIWSNTGMSEVTGMVANNKDHSRNTAPATNSQHIQQQEQERLRKLTEGPKKPRRCASLECLLEEALLVS